MIFASNEFVGEGIVVDLGVPACAVESDTAPLPGDYVRLHVFMPDEEGPLEVGLAKVRCAKQQQFGVEFLKLSNGQQVRVGRLFRALQARAVSLINGHLKPANDFRPAIECQFA